MNGWGDVLQWLALIAGGAALLVGIAWGVGRIFRPWMRNEVREGNEALYERLRGNDFKHIEDRIGEGLAGVNKRLDGIDSRFGRVENRMNERMREARVDRAAMEERIGERLGRIEAALTRRGAEDPDRT